MQVPQRRSQSLKKRDEDEFVYLTPEGIQKQKDTLVYLEKTERPKIVIDLTNAIALGDLSENAEYHDAKSRLANIDGRIFGIKDHLRRVKAIESGTDATQTVRMGSTVTVESNGKQRTYQVVGTQESDPTRGRISYQSPLGTELMGKRIGETATVKTEEMTTDYRIIDVQ